MLGRFEPDGAAVARSTRGSTHHLANSAIFSLGTSPTGCSTCCVPARWRRGPIPLASDSRTCLLPDSIEPARHFPDTDQLDNQSVRDIGPTSFPRPFLSRHLLWAHDTLHLVATPHSLAHLDGILSPTRGFRSVGPSIYPPKLFPSDPFIIFPPRHLVGPNPHIPLFVR